MKSLREIELLLDGYDNEILDDCNEFLDGRIDKERSRGEAAEQRASIILGVVSAVSAILVASDIIGLLRNAKCFSIIIYVASIIWLLRAVFFAMKSIKNQVRYQVTPETIFDFKNMTPTDVKRQIVVGKYWEYQHNVQPNTEKLFCVQRSQRSLVVSISFLLTLGFFVMGNSIPESWDYYISLFLSFIIIMFWICGDYFFEKRDGWKPQ